MFTVMRSLIWTVALLTTLALPSGVARPTAAVLTLTPTSGVSGGTTIHLTGTGFGASERVTFYWDGTQIPHLSAMTTGGVFTTSVALPAGLLPGADHIAATGGTTGRTASTEFTVEPLVSLPTWVQIPTPRPYRDNQAFGAAGGRVFSVGGDLEQSFGKPPVQSYVPGATMWVTVAQMAVWNDRFAVVNGLNGEMYALGGSQGTGSVLQAYNPSTNTWTLLAPMPVGRYEFGAAVDRQGRIYTVGGLCAPPPGKQVCKGGVSALAEVDVYTPSTNTWTKTAPLSYPRSVLAVAADSDGNIYALGGGESNFTGLLAEAYDPTREAWRDLPSLPEPRDYEAAATGTDGRIYVIGGVTCVWGGVCNDTNSVAVYTPATNTWTQAPNDMDARAALSATTGPDGRIYVSSGLTSSSYVNITEAYGPIISLTPASGPADATAVVSGTNFAANATVTLTWPSGIVLGSGHTDGGGHLTAPITITIPSSAATGSDTVTSEDNVSHYPVYAPFTVTSAAPVAGVRRAWLG